MKFIFRISKFLLILVLAVFFSFTSINKVSAAPQCHAIATGNWNDSAIWSNCHGVGGIPDATDSVSISTDSTVTINTPGAVANSFLIYNPTDATRSLVIVSPGSLSVTGNINLQQNMGVGHEIIDVGDGSLSASNINILGGAVGDSIVSVSTGTINISGNISFGNTAANARLISTGASTINIGGDLGDGGTLTTNGTGTINFNGSGAQIIGSYTYNNLVISNTSSFPIGGVTLGGDVVINGTLDVNGNLDISSNNLNVTGNITIGNGGQLSYVAVDALYRTFNGNVIIENGGILNEGPGISAVFFGGNFENNGTYISDSNIAHEFSGTGKTISGTTSTVLPFLSITGTITNNLVIEAAPQLSISGSLANNSSITSANISGNGQLVNNAFGVINFTGDDASFFSITNLDLAAIGNTVNYSKNGDQTLRWATYYNLGLLISGNKTNDPMSLSHVTNNLIIDGPVVFYPNNGMEIKGLNYDGTQQPAGRYGSMSTNYDYQVSFLNGTNEHITVTNVVNAPGTPTAVAGPTINGTEETTGFDVVVSLGTSGAIVGDSVSLLLDGSQIYNTSGSVGTASYIPTDPGERNDATYGGTYTGPASCSLIVGMASLADGPHGYDQFIYGLVGSGCSGGNMNPTEITPGQAQALIYGTTITFAHGTGHSMLVLGQGPESSYWSATLTPGVLNVNYIHQLSTEDISTGSYTFHVIHGTLGDDGVKTITAKIVRVNTAGNESDPLLLTLDTYVAPLPDPIPTQQTTVLIIPVAPLAQGPSGGSNGGSNSGSNSGGSIPGCAPENIFSTTTGQRCSSSSDNHKSTYQFTRTLKLGMSGDDIIRLQQFLNSHGAQVTKSGNGSPGHEIRTFGKATQKALAKYQQANNISPALGNFGPITMKFVNAVLLAEK